MASTILSGTGNVSWTNNTGGNVRVIIYYFGANNVASTTNGLGISMNAGGATITAAFTKAVGKNLASSYGYLSSTHSSSSFVQNNMASRIADDHNTFPQALPTELVLANTRTLSITLTGGTASYNILIIPEDG